MTPETIPDDWNFVRVYGTSPERDPRKQCYGKRAFNTSPRAVAEILFVRSVNEHNAREDPTWDFDPRDKNLCVYKCPHCHKWHIGHDKRREDP